MDEMRAMLDDLMGKDRNMSLQEREKIKPKKKHFTDRDICKYYICGFCPYEEFHRTKQDFGECPHIHDDDCKSEWEALSDKEKDRYPYEKDLLRWLDKLLSDLNKRIAANTARLSAPQRSAGLSPDEQHMLDTMTKQIDELLEKAEKLGEEGEVDAAEATTAEAEALKQRRDEFAKQAEAKSGGGITKGLVQTVCPVSGLIINEEENRMRDHKTGRNYMAWKKLHETHAALDEIMKKRREERSRYSDDRDRYRDRDRSDRGGDRRRDGDRRHRSRSYDRTRKRSRSRDRGGIGSHRRYYSSSGGEKERENGVVHGEEKKEEFVRELSPGEVEEGEAPPDQ